MKRYNSIWKAAAAVPAALLLVCALLFASCDNPMEPANTGMPGTDITAPDNGPAVQNKKASVSFGISVEGDARTVLPDMSGVNLDELTLMLIGQKDGAAEQPFGEIAASGTTLALEPGEWTFTLNAVNTDEDIVLTANAEAALEADKSTEVEFTLMPLKEGTGAVNISFTWPAVGITRVTTGGELEEDDIDLSSANGTWSYQVPEMDAGDYFAVFSFYSGGDGDVLTAVVSETIQVRSGLTSKKTAAITINDLKNFTRPVGNTLAEKFQWLALYAAYDTNYLVELTADDAIPPMNLSYAKTGVSITLTGIDRERIISLSSVGGGTTSMFTVGDGVTLTLENNITLNGRTDNNAALVSVERGGTLIMNDGAKISRNTSTSNGSGVYVSGGTFTMNGGEISRNTESYTAYGTVYVSSIWYGGQVSGTFTMNGGKISGNTSASSAGGTVYVSSGTFTMEGGEISGNTSHSGVYVSTYGDTRGTFTMNGGAISGNTSTNGNGGGVYVSSGGTFTMNDGAISGNTGYRGGVYVVSDNNIERVGTFTMNDGAISGNIPAVGENSVSVGGGGVYVGAGGTFTMEDGEISENTSSTYGGVYVAGGGVYGGTITNGGTFTMEGGAISGNTSSASGGGVHVDDGGTYDDGIFTKTAGVIYGNDASDSALANNTAFDGHAVYWQPHLFRDNTLGESDSISTADTGNGWEHPISAPLADGWNNGELEAGENEWFSFEASAATEYIHVRFGTLADLNVQVYDSDWELAASGSRLSGNTTYMKLTGLSAGTNYIRVTPYNSGGSGDYEIGMNDYPTVPGTAPTVLADGWSPGSIEAGGREWFSFTANAATKYIHVSFGELDDLIVQVYDSAWGTVGSFLNLYSSTTYMKLAGLNTGTYYIRVTPYNSGGSGDYQIGVNDYPTVPGTAPTVLADGWSPGSIEAGGREWFSFTANAATKYIHVSFGELDYLDVRVYDSAWEPFGSNLYLTGTTTYKQLTGLSEGTYYVEVRPTNSYSGDYQIGVTESLMPPGTVSTELAGGWNNDNIETGGEKWFSFTASGDGDQYVHVRFGALDNLNVQVYNSAWESVVSRSTLSGSTGSTTYKQLTGLSVGTNYIRVWPYASGSSGNYEICVNDTPMSPGTAPTELAGGWSPGSIEAGGREWFSFTASGAADQYVHVKFETWLYMNVQVYNSAWESVVSRSTLSGDAGSTTYKQFSGLGAGTYYIEVTPSGSYSGDYQIGVNESPMPVETAPTELADEWSQGSLDENGAEWFSFTTNVYHDQYVHVKFDTLTVLYVQVYNSAWESVVSRSTLSGSTGSTTYKQLSGLSAGTYYIEVTPFGSYSGDYQIGVNDYPTVPGTAPTELADGWSPGSLEAEGEEWFSFTANDTTHIHVNFVSFITGGLNVQVYTEASVDVTGLMHFDYYPTYVSVPGLVSGQTYYIKVTPYYSYYSGLYQIAVNSVPEGPPV